MSVGGFGGAESFDRLVTILMILLFVSPVAALDFESDSRRPMIGEPFNISHIAGHMIRFSTIKTA